MLHFRGGSRIFFRRGCTRLLLYFNTNKPHSFCRIPVVLENRRSSRGWGGGGGGPPAPPPPPPRTPCTLPLDPPCIYHVCHLFIPQYLYICNILARSKFVQIHFFFPCSTFYIDQLGKIRHYHVIRFD